MTKKLGVFVSGAGTTLDNLCEAIKNGTLDAEIVTVVSNRVGIGACDICKKHGLIICQIPRKGGGKTDPFDAYGSTEAWSAKLYDWTDFSRPELIILAGFDQKLHVPDRFAGRILNIHPALLPKYGGKGMYGLRVHEAVLAAKEEWTGCTVHVVDNEYDHGLILAQSRVRVSPDDTPETLQKRVQEAERKLLPAVINSYDVRVVQAMRLTDEQKNAVKGIVGDLDNQQCQTLGGYAGTGKTTVIAVLQEALKRKNLSFAVCAYTGKAARVLGKKGIPASTIHSLIYHAVRMPDDSVKWVLTTKWDLVGRGIGGFIIDEASMVSKEIHEDLMTFGLPIIYVGDHGQLEPIGTPFNVMARPMYRLETIHRNAGEIAHFAEHIRKGNPATTFKTASKVQLVKASGVEDRHLSATDQIICAFNKTRVELNERVRKERRINYAYIAPNEKIICLRNRRPELLFNGMQGVVTKIRENDRFDFVSDGMLFEKVLYDPDQFGKETNEFEYSQAANPFDYAYAITAHKAQGDEWPNVIVYEQRCSMWDNTRWAYTAASRAKESLVWIPVEEYIPKYLR